MDGRDEHGGGVGRELELAGEAERDAAELTELQATLERLRQVRCRIAQRQLEPADLELFRALLDEEIATR